MSDNPINIHDFDFELICEYFSALERQGPGSPEATLQAFEFIPKPGADAQIADLGCGSGGQTMTIAQHCPAQITGVDLFPRFIDQFNQNAHRLGLGHRVKGIVGSMDQLPFPDAYFDLIWSEGAIYNIGFKRGLAEWRRFIKPGGYLAVTDASWFTLERPAEIHDFWMQAYPEMDTIASRINAMQDAGYLPLASFILPEDCWLEQFYLPQESIQEPFLKKYPGNPGVESFIANERHEAELYRKYKNFYGYVFYIGKKL